MDNCSCPITASSSSNPEEWSYGDILSAVLNVVLAIISAGLLARLSKANSTSHHSVTATLKEDTKPDGSKLVERKVEASIATSADALKMEMQLNTKKAASTGSGKDKDDVAVTAAGMSPAVKSAAVGAALEAAMRVTDPKASTAQVNAAIIDIAKATQDPAHTGAKALFTEGARRASITSYMSHRTDASDTKSVTGKGFPSVVTDAIRVSHSDEASHTDILAPTSPAPASPASASSAPVRPVSASPAASAGGGAKEAAGGAAAETPGESAVDISDMLSRLAASGALNKIIADADIAASAPSPTGATPADHVTVAVLGAGTGVHDGE